MSKENQRGEFTSSLLSLQLQIETLLEGAGGQEASELLDSLSQLTKSEQTTALKSFKQVIDRLLEEEDRYLSAEDIELKKFEDGLYSEIVNSLQEAANGGSSKRFEVVPGGKVRKTLKKKDKGLIDFQAAREARQSSAPPKPVVN